MRQEGNTLRAEACVLLDRRVLSRDRTRHPWPRLAVFLLLLHLPTVVAFAEGAKLQPVDEAPNDAEFMNFRKQLIHAVRKHDLTFVLSVLDPQIKNSFGGESGTDEFKSMWQPESADSQLWDTLLRLLSMGGSFSGKDSELYFLAPYVYSRWPNEFDPFEYAAITGTNVNLRREASPDAPVLARLSYNIVKLDPDESSANEITDSSWVRVTTLDGISGYVSSRYLYSPVGYRAGFIKRDGKWRMQFLIAGD